MTWVDVTMPQLAAAEEWWESRTAEERRRDWPEKSYGRQRILGDCWRVWDGQSRRGFAATLINAGLICKPIETKSDVPVRRVPRVA